MAVAIITGASSGFGRALAKAIYRKYPDIDELWLIARRTDRLKELAEALPGRRVEVLPLDLTDMDSFDLLKAFMNAKRPILRMLINDAGYGKFGPFRENPLEAETGMVDLNCRAVLAMTKLALPYMQPGGCVINVASVAAFSPTPGMAVYAATKAFAVSFTRALREELRGSRINAIAVCPGPMETEFFEVAGIDTKEERFRKFRWLPLVSVDAMAEGALRKGLARRAVYTGKPAYRIFRALAKLLPHSLVARLSKL